MTTNDGEPEGEYSKFKMKIQRGDGPDQRGEVTVEIVREIETQTPDGLSLRSVDVEGESVDVGVNNEPFAEFALECSRATRLLTDQLGLDTEEDEEE